MVGETILKKKIIVELLFGATIFLCHVCVLEYLKRDFDGKNEDYVGIAWDNSSYLLCLSIWTS